MDKKILVIVICVLFFVVILGYGFLSDNNNDDDVDDQDNGNGDNNNGGEPEFDVDILASSDKEEYTSGEIVNITLKVSNHMNVSFPFGSYGFGLNYVNKIDYDFGDEYTPVEISKALLTSIIVQANETYSYFIPFNTTGVDSGEYYVRFEIYKFISYDSYEIDASSVFDIVII